MDVLDAIARSISRNRTVEALLEVQEGEACEIQNGMRRDEP